MTAGSFKQKAERKADQSPQQAVAYIISSLSMGGAQKVLLQLLASKLSQAFPPACVIALRRVSDLEEQCNALAVPVIYLETERPWLIPLRLWQIIRLLRRQKVSLLYSLLHHGNLFAALLKPAVKFFINWRVKLVWSMHDTPLPGLYTRWDHRFFLWLTHKLTALPERIVLVSARSQQRYTELGYPQEKMTLIANGVPIPDYDASAIDAARREVRAALRLGADAILIGSLTRYVVEKDIPCMLAAFRLLCAEKSSVYLLLAGEGMEAGNAELCALIAELGIADRVMLLGVRKDARRLLQALDIATLSSRSEALPLFLAEAMAEGIPCVASRVGDVPLLLGEAGVLVQPENPQVLVEGWRGVLELSADERQGMVAAARARVAEEFGEQRMVRRHLELYAGLELE